MLATFIPYFVAANLTTNASSWSRGPEYVFTTNLVLYANTSRNEELINSVTHLDIRCQPRYNDTLTCASTLASYYIGNTLAQRRPEDNKIDHFEMRFNASGIANVTLPADMAWPKKLAFKRVASLFSVGIDLSDSAVTSPEGTTESSLLGQCRDTLIKVKTQEASGHAEHSDGQTYNLYPIPFNGNKRRMNIEIDKIRDPKKCSDTAANYFFIPPPSKVEIKTSASKITVSDSGLFDSWTILESTVEKITQDEYRMATMSERLQITLSSVKEAIEPIPPISNPSVVSIAVLPNDLEVPNKK